jgi:hypothetical protein
MLRRWPILTHPNTRFWLKVWPRGDCWEWRGSRHNGYGQFFNGKEPPMRAHRYAFALAYGFVPPFLDHLCNHRWCVRPSHLTPTTHRDNTLRGTSICALNARKTHCKSGHPLVGDNLRILANGRRRCRACDRLYCRRQKEKRSA